MDVIRVYKKTKVDKKMIEYKNLWSNNEIIRENPEKYKEWKINQIITGIMKFLITHDYNITYEYV